MANFREIINSETPTLVDFHAEWCGPCHMQAPILKELSAWARNKVKILKVDVDKNPKAAAHYGIRSIPTLILFKEGKIVWQHNGVAQLNQLKNILETNT
jgi:thioredoxin 1